MISIENANTHGLFEEESLRAFESDIGVSLPQDNRVFPSQFNGMETDSCAA
jgi:hypothetical protein